MPLKPIFDKAPLIALNEISLRPGQIHTELEIARGLYAMADRAAALPSAWEGVFRLAAAVTADAKAEPVAGWINAEMAKQQEDGALPLPLTDAVAVMRAALAMYELDAKRPLLEQLLKWCGWLAANWDEAISCTELRVHSADLMALLLALYRISGKKGVLGLCGKLRQQAMDWSGILHTFAVQRPMNRVTPYQDMEAGMEAEGGNESGFYTRQYLTCHAASLADGMRASAMNGQFSGNGHELTAGKIGWEKISRYHGAVCGGVTANETIGGTSPACAVDAAALGAWLEAFCAQPEGEAWACDAAEAILCNGLPAAVCGDGLVAYQRVNGLSADIGTKDCYHVHAAEEQFGRAYGRLCRGLAAVLGQAVTMTREGANINHYVCGRYVLPLKDASCALTLSGGDFRYTATLKLRKAVRAAIRIRVPSWTESACISVNDEGGYEGKPGAWLKLEREWNDGDVIRIDFVPSLHVEAGHHQSLCVKYGACVMAYEPDEHPWAAALCGIRLEDGKVIATLRKATGWRKQGDLPADLPVLPPCEGEAFTAELVPYAATLARIALFPKGDA